MVRVADEARQGAQNISNVFGITATKGDHAKDDDYRR
jgi:hypothetical protein